MKRLINGVFGMLLVAVVGSMLLARDEVKGKKG